MRTFVLFIAIAAILSTCCQRVSGDLLVEMLQIGNDVVVTSEGTVNTATLGVATSSENFGGLVIPREGDFINAIWITGVPFETTTNPSTDLYYSPVPVIGPSSFGSGAFSVPDSGFGDVHGFRANPSQSSSLNPFIVVPAGYVSGDFLFSQMTFRNKSFVDLGVTEGTYNWSFPGNEITLIIVVPLGLPPTIGDVNQDGEVTFADIDPFIEVLMTGSFLEEADCNQDGEVTFADIAPFIEILSAG